MDRLQRWLRRSFKGLWRSPDFRKLWISLTVTSFGAQITNLALPLTAALLLHATPLQMGVLVALETLPFALVSLHAGVLLDRVRKLPIVIMSDVARGAALLAIPIAAFTDHLTIEILYGVGFFCGVQNVVGGAAYQVLLAQLAGRKRLVEANAKIALGETSSALVGPGVAGGLIQLLTAPFAILLDAVAFFASALMLRRMHAPNDVPHDGPEGVGHGRDRRGAEARVGQPHAVRARVAVGAVAVPAPHADRGADPVRDARPRAVGGRDRPHVHVRRTGLRDRGRERGAAVRALRRGPGHRARPHPDRARVAGVRPDRRAGVGRHAPARPRDAGVRLRRRALRHQLPVAATGDHAGPAARPHDRDDALPDRRDGAAGLARSAACSRRTSACAARC